MANLAKTETGQLATATDWDDWGAAPITEGIILPGMYPASVRANCGEGRFYGGGQTADSIAATVLQARECVGDLGMSVGEQWLQLIFVPAPGQLLADVVCSMYIKTQSRQAYNALVVGLISQRQHPMAGLFDFKFEKAQAGNGKTYYWLNPTWRERKGDELYQVSRLQEFVRGTAQPIPDDPQQTARLNFLDAEGLDSEGREMLISDAIARKEEARAAQGSANV